MENKSDAKEYTYHIISFRGDSRTDKLIYRDRGHYSAAYGEWESHKELSEMMEISGSPLGWWLYRVYFIKIRS